MSFNECVEEVNMKNVNVVRDEESQSSSLRLIKCPSFSFESSSDLHYDISLTELMKASNSVLNQVN